MDVVKMKPIQFFVPFDAVARAAGAKGLDESWVPGYAFVNEVVRGEGGRALKRSAMESASKSWFEKWGNVREMHGANAAGVVRHSNWDDTGWFVAAEIVDPVAKLKCERGVYKGYSVKVQPTRAQGLDVIECEMIELSLVDRPKDPDALFSIYRSEEYDPGLAYDVELVPAGDGAISSVERRTPSSTPINERLAALTLEQRDRVLEKWVEQEEKHIIEGDPPNTARRAPGSTPLDSPEAISAGSTYYGEDPMKVGICAIAQEGDRFCVFGPDGQKLGEFPSMAEARTRAEEITAAMKSEANLDGNERPIGGPGQDQNAGPMMKLSDPAAGDERRALGAVPGSTLEGSTSDTQPGTLNLEPGTPSLQEGEPVQIVRDTGTGRYQLYRDGMSQFLHECATQEEMGAFIREAIARAQTSATVPSRENLEGKAKKKKEDDDDETDEAMGGDEGADGEPKKRKKKAAMPEEKERVLTVADLRRLADELEAREQGVKQPEVATDSAAAGAVLEDPAKDEYRAAGGAAEIADRMMGEEKPKGDYGSHADAGYADPGHQADRKPRYPLKEGGKLDSKRVHAAWSYINQADNASKYSSEDLAKVKGRIRSAAKEIGMEISDEKERVSTACMEWLDRATGIVYEMAEADLPENVTDYAPLQRVIKNEDGRWVLYSMDGSKKLGSFDSKQKAEDREREINYFKQEKRGAGLGGRSSDGSDRSDGSDPSGGDRGEEFFCRLARLEDENLILTTRLESAVGEIATAQEATEEAKRLLASAEEQVARLAAMPAPLTRINTPVLFPEALPRTFLANRRDGASNELDELQREVDELLKLPPTNDAGEQNSRATRMNLARTRMQQVFRE